MRILLDATELVADYYLRGPRFLQLLHAARAGHVWIFVPELVIRETVAKHKEELANALTRAENSANRLGRLLPDRVSIDEIRTQVRAAEAGYESELRDRLEIFRVRVRGFPNVGHEALVSRAIDHRKPFSPGGKGYRDALIWHTALELVSPGSDPIYLVTNNTSDFADSGTTALSSQLVDDLTAQKCAADAVVLVPGLTRLLEDFVGPVLRTASEVREEIISSADHLAAVNRLVHEAASRLTKSDAESLQLPLPEGIDNPEVDGSEAFGEVSIVEVHVLDENQFLVDAAVDGVLHFSGFVDKSELAGFPSDVAILEENWNDHSAWVGFSRQADLLFGVLYDRKTAEFRDAEPYLPVS